MADFVAKLDPINALADGSPGFVWRLTGDDVDPYAAKLFGVDKLLFNMSVWESLEALKNYVYASNHVNVLQRRAKWFEAPEKSPFVLWWIEKGRIPTIDEAKERFDKLWAEGPTAAAFTFAKPFDV